MPASRIPTLEGTLSSKHCTNCSARMTAYRLAGHYRNTVEVDVCMDCNAIWFDQYESTALSPDGTVALFELIHQRGGTATRAATKFGEKLRCVTCGEGMQLTHDQVKGTRFAYQACRKGHGRLTTFYNFLAEKQFVRELTKTERTKLAATVQQVRCSGCGAAVNLGKVDACEYCRAPVSVFDREAARKAIEHYLLERQRPPPQLPEGDRRTSHRAAGDWWNTANRADVGTDILFALGRAALRGVSGVGRTANTGSAAGALLGSIFAGGAGAALPDATSALFGADQAAGALGDAVPAVGEGVVDLVTDGIDSLLGALFD
jgi:hypothetical protein